MLEGEGEIFLTSYEKTVAKPIAKQKNLKIGIPLYENVYEMTKIQSWWIICKKQFHEGGVYGMLNVVCEGTRTS